MTCQKRTGKKLPCLFISFYHSLTKTALAMHYDDNTRKEDLAAVLEMFLDYTNGKYNELQVTIIGGEEGIVWWSSKENVDKTLQFFINKGITPATLVETYDQENCFEGFTVFIDARNGNIGILPYRQFSQCSTIGTTNCSSNNRTNNNNGSRKYRGC